MVVNTQRWTIQDLDPLPDDGGWTRYEIINGELLVTRAPHIAHQSAAMNLCTPLDTWSKETGLGRVFQTPGVIFTPTDAVIPALIWISLTTTLTPNDTLASPLLPGFNIPVAEIFH